MHESVYCRLKTFQWMLAGGAPSVASSRVPLLFDILYYNLLSALLWTGPAWPSALSKATRESRTDRVHHPPRAERLLTFVRNDGKRNAKRTLRKSRPLRKAAATNANSRITNRVTLGLSLPRSSITFTATDASGYFFNLLRHDYLRPSQRTASSKSLFWSLLVKILSPWPMFM
jgi:hypothetical protein